jgi:hypothetical protein
MDYVEEYKCGSCGNYTYEGKYTKGYCSLRGVYYYADDSCDKWIESENAYYSSSGGCFLTTACCVYKGLPDDCHELETLRFLRDTYLKKTSFGESLIKNYYDTAPAIVDKINALDNRDEIYDKIYERITTVVKLIEQRKNDDAVCEYVSIMLWVDKL